MFYIWERYFSINEKAVAMFTAGESKLASKPPYELIMALGDKAGDNFKSRIDVVNKFAEEGGKYLCIVAPSVSPYVIDILAYANMLGLETGARINPVPGDIDKIKKVTRTVILNMTPSPTIASEDINTHILQDYYKEYSSEFGVDLHVNSGNVDSCVKVYKAALDLAKPILMWFIKAQDMSEDGFKCFLDLISKEDAGSKLQSKPSYEVWKYKDAMSNPSSMSCKSCAICSKLAVINDNMEIVPCYNYLLNNIPGTPYEDDLRLTSQVVKSSATECGKVCTFYDATMNIDKNLKRWFLGVKE